MSNTLNLNAVPLNNIKDYVKANVSLQCSQLHAPRLAIQGAPGTGKSDIIAEMCEENGWVLSVKYLSNMSLEQITGIPCKVEHGSTAIWSKPELFNFDFPEYAPEAYFTASEEEKNKFVKVLLIDDFHLADRIMQKYLFQLLTYKSLNGYKLPENTAILLAGNRNTDRALANPIPAPVCNRLLFMEVKSDVKDWLDNFAFKHGVRSDITSYLYNNGDVCLSSEPLESGAWASPRAWTYLSYQMDAYEAMHGRIGISELKNMAAGLIGAENAGKFIEYRELFAKWDFDKLSKMPWEDVKARYKTEVESNITDCYAIVSAGTAWLLTVYKNNKFDINAPEVKDALQFVYDTFIFLMLFPGKAGIRRNTRPLLVAGTKYIHMYQQSIQKHIGNMRISSLLAGFIKGCMAKQRDEDYLFYEILGIVFDQQFSDDDKEKIAQAKKNLAMD
jgi:hypothetical protein